MNGEQECNQRTPDEAASDPCPKMSRPINRGEIWFHSHIDPPPHFRATPLRSLTRLAIVCSIAGKFVSALVELTPCSCRAHETVQLMFTAHASGTCVAGENIQGRPDQETRSRARTASSRTRAAECGQPA